MTGQPREADVWTASPLSPTLADEARQLVARLDGPQRLWLSGYLAGAALHAAPVAAPVTGPGRAEVTILFGSQTGNAERLAKELAADLTQRNVGCSVVDMLDCRPAQLAQARTLLVVVSTQGEGDPPERALPLVELLRGRKAPRLDHVKYSVLIPALSGGNCAGRQGAGQVQPLSRGQRQWRAVERAVSGEHRRDADPRSAPPLARALRERAIGARAIWRFRGENGCRAADAERPGLPEMRSGRPGRRKA